MCRCCSAKEEIFEIILLRLTSFYFSLLNTIVPGGILEVQKVDMIKPYVCMFANANTTTIPLHLTLRLSMPNEIESSLMRQGIQTHFDGTEQTLDKAIGPFCKCIK